MMDGCVCTSVWSINTKAQEGGGGGVTLYMTQSTREIKIGQNIQLFVVAERIMNRYKTKAVT